MEQFWLAVYALIMGFVLALGLRLWRRKRISKSECRHDHIFLFSIEEYKEYDEPDTKFYARLQCARCDRQWFKWPSSIFAASLMHDGGMLPRRITDYERGRLGIPYG